MSKYILKAIIPVILFKYIKSIQHIGHHRTIKIPKGLIETTESLYTFVKTMTRKIKYTT